MTALFPNGGQKKLLTSICLANGIVSFENEDIPSNLQNCKISFERINRFAARSDGQKTALPSSISKNALLSAGQKSVLVVFDKGVLYNESGL